MPGPDRGNINRSGWLERIAAAPDPVKRLVIKVSVAVLTLCIAVIWLASLPWQNQPNPAAPPDPKAEELKAQASQSLRDAQEQFSGVGEQIRQVLGQRFGQVFGQKTEKQPTRLPSAADTTTTSQIFGQTELESLAKEIEGQASTSSYQNSNITR